MVSRNRVRSGPGGWRRTDVSTRGTDSEREFTQRLGRVLRPKDDGERALLYALVSEETVEEDVAARRR